MTVDSIRTTVAKCLRHLLIGKWYDRAAVVG